MSRVDTHRLRLIYSRYSQFCDAFGVLTDKASQIDKKCTLAAYGAGFIKSCSEMVARDFHKGNIHMMEQDIYNLVPFLKVCFVKFETDELIQKCNDWFLSAGKTYDKLFLKADTVFNHKGFLPVAKDVIILVESDADIFEQFCETGLCDEVLSFVHHTKDISETNIKQFFINNREQIREYLISIYVPSIRKIPVSNTLQDMCKVIKPCQLMIEMSDTVLSKTLEEYKQNMSEIFDTATTLDGMSQVCLMPIEALKDGNSGIRIAPLLDAGFKTIGDVYNIDPRGLYAVKGISRDSGIKIRHRIEEMAAKLEPKHIPIVFDYDNRIPEVTLVVRILYGASRFLTYYRRLRKCSPVDIYSLESDMQQFDVILCETLWPFMDNTMRRDIILAYRRLKEAVSSDYCGYIRRCAAVFPDRYSVEDDDVAWDDYKQHTEVYWATLRYFVPKAQEDDGSNYGLPDTIAEKVSARQILDYGSDEFSLRRYQEWGVKFILEQKRVLLGDEMGLGKTIQAIGAMRSLAFEGATHFLVVCPASVLINWVKEIRRFSVFDVYEGHGKLREWNRDRWFKSGGVLVTTYETLHMLHVNNYDEIGLLVVDEAHYIKNPEAARSKMIRCLTDKVERVLFMTGTAIENNVEEMLMLIRYLNDDVAVSAARYVDMRYSDKFRNSVASVYFRRKREDVVTELPEKIEEEIWCPMNAAEMQAYIAVVMAYKVPFMPMRRVSWMLDNLNLSNKALTLFSIVSQAASENRKVLVFSFFKDTMMKVKAMFGDRCLGPIDGSVSPVRRQSIVDRFNTANDIRVLVAQVVAGGVGMNIQAASVVVLCEPQIKPSMEDQAIARAYRIGQSRNVLVYRLCSNESIDEGIISMLKKKRDQFDSFADRSVSGDESLALTENDMKAILKTEIERCRNYSQNG